MIPDGRLNVLGRAPALAVCRWIQREPVYLA
jgi:hypothetical protein